MNVAATLYRAAARGRLSGRMNTTNEQTAKTTWIGMTFDKVLETGGIALGDEVSLSLDVFSMASRGIRSKCRVLPVTRTAP